MPVQLLLYLNYAFAVNIQIKQFAILQGSRGEQKLLYCKLYLLK